MTVSQINYLGNHISQMPSCLKLDTKMNATFIKSYCKSLDRYYFLEQVMVISYARAYGAVLNNRGKHCENKLLKQKLHTVKPLHEDYKLRSLE